MPSGLKIMHYMVRHLPLHVSLSAKLFTQGPRFQQGTRLVATGASALGRAPLNLVHTLYHMYTTNLLLKATLILQGLRTGVWAAEIIMGFPRMQAGADAPVHLKLSALRWPWYYA
jgi:hypothetical protein